jgi:hypothetical protein
MKTAHPIRTGSALNDSEVCLVLCGRMSRDGGSGSYGGFVMRSTKSSLWVFSGSPSSMSYIAFNIWRERVRRLLPNCSMRYPWTAGTSLEAGSRYPALPALASPVSPQVQFLPGPRLSGGSDKGQVPRACQESLTTLIFPPRAPRDWKEQPHGSQQLTGPVQRSPN